jgi:hypothetical protein
MPHHDMMIYLKTRMHAANNTVAAHIRFAFWINRPFFCMLPFEDEKKKRGKRKRFDS